MRVSLAGETRSTVVVDALDDRGKEPTPRNCSGEPHEPTVRRFVVSHVKIADSMKHELNRIPRGQRSKVESLLGRS